MHRKAEFSLDDWMADSRGLLETFWEGNVGYMSPFAVQKLESMSVDTGPRTRFPIHLTKTDLQNSEMVIALDETEHRSMMEKRFPQWVEKTVFWTVHDIDRWKPEQALSQIQQHVEDLMRRLTSA